MREENADELVVKAAKKSQTTVGNMFWFAANQEGFHEVERVARDRYHEWLKGEPLPDFVRRFCTIVLNTEV